jgi:hypothetical protein
LQFLTWSPCGQDTGRTWQFEISGDNSVGLLAPRSWRCMSCGDEMWVPFDGGSWDEEVVIISTIFTDLVASFVKNYIASE